jgi:sRNA-binding carbon storage regulator CsrA
MLCLNRDVDQTIHLHTSDGTITIMLVRIVGPLTAKLGITAPATVKILRSELGNFREERRNESNR